MDIKELRSLPICSKLGVTFISATTVGIDLDEELKSQVRSEPHVQLGLYLGLNLDEGLKTQAPSQTHIQLGLYLGLDLDQELYLLLHWEVRYNVR